MNIPPINQTSNVPGIISRIQTHSTVSIREIIKLGINTLLGKTACCIYLAGICIIILGVLGRKFLNNAYSIPQTNTIQSQTIIKLSQERTQSRAFMKTIFWENIIHPDIKIKLQEIQIFLQIQTPLNELQKLIDDCLFKKKSPQEILDKLIIECKSPISSESHSQILSSLNTLIPLLDNPQYNTNLSSTLEILPNGTELTLPSGEDLSRRSTCYHLNDIERKVQVGERLSENQYPTHITVVNQDCVDVAQEQSALGNNVVIVSFGCHDSPAGNSPAGYGTQEEEICFRTTLSRPMNYQLCYIGTPPFSYFPLHYQNESREIIQNTAKLIYTPDVLVFRAGTEHNYKYLDQPFTIGVISGAPREHPPLINEGTTEVDYANEEDKKIVELLIIAQLYAAYSAQNHAASNEPSSDELKSAPKSKYDTLVLGAFGCGTYANPTRTVAKLYKKVIEKHFKGAFKNIIFAIKEPRPYSAKHAPNGNVKPFADCFLQPAI